MNTDNKIISPSRAINQDIFYFDTQQGTVSMGRIQSVRTYIDKFNNVIQYDIVNSEGITVNCIPEKLTFKDLPEVQQWCADLYAYVSDIKM